MNVIFKGNKIYFTNNDIDYDKCYHIENIDEEFFIDIVKKHNLVLKYDVNNDIYSMFNEDKKKVLQQYILDKFISEKSSATLNSLNSSSLEKSKNKIISINPDKIFYFNDLDNFTSISCHSDNDENNIAIPETNDKGKKKIKCECGKEILHSSYKRHLLTKSHGKLIQK